MRPLLFVDIDGVLNPHGSEVCPPGYVEHALFPVDDEPVRVCQEHGAWLHELADHFDLMWGTAWTEADRVVLGTVLSLPEFRGAVVLPRGRFDPGEKVPAVAALAGSRAVAWIDDMLTTDAWSWAEDREAPTLLVPIDPAFGLTREVVDRLVAWAEELARSR